MKKYSNKTVIESLGLPMLTCFDDWLTKQDAEGRYKTFFIEKKDGDKRKINAPSLSLKIVQRWVLENILYKIKSITIFIWIYERRPKRLSIGVLCGKT